MGLLNTEIKGKFKNNPLPIKTADLNSRLFCNIRIDNENYFLGPNLSRPSIVGCMKPLLIKAHKNRSAKAPIPTDIRNLPCSCGSSQIRPIKVKAAYKTTKTLDKLGFIFFIKNY